MPQTKILHKNQNQIMWKIYQLFKWKPNEWKKHISDSKYLMNKNKKINKAKIKLIKIYFLRRSMLCFIYRIGFKNTHTFQPTFSLFAKIVICPKFLSQFFSILFLLDIFTCLLFNIFFWSFFFTIIQFSLFLAYH